MSVTGLCQICEAAQARYACDRCGRMVCPDHYDRELGVCSDCAKQLRGDERTGDRGERGAREHRDRGRDDRPDDWGEPR